MANHPFSPPVVELYLRIKQTSDYQARRSLVIDLAAQFQRQHDDSNPEIDPELHDLVEEYEAAKLAYQHASLSLGRAAMNIMEAFEENGATFEAEAKDDPKPN